MNLSCHETEWRLWSIQELTSLYVRLYLNRARFLRQSARFVAASLQPVLILKCWRWWRALIAVWHCRWRIRAPRQRTRNVGRTTIPDKAALLSMLTVVNDF